LPFGVHRVPVLWGPLISRRTRPEVSIAFRSSPRSGRWPAKRGLELGVSLHCLSAFTAFRSDRGNTGYQDGTASLHCLSAFTAFRSGTGPRGPRKANMSLHCLSAFTAFRSGRRSAPAGSSATVSIAFRRSPRSGPMWQALYPVRPEWSPLPFGVHRVPVQEDQLEAAFAAIVSIAFRRSPRSGPGTVESPMRGRDIVSIAFRRSPRSGLRQCNSFRRRYASLRQVTRRGIVRHGFC